MLHDSQEALTFPEHLRGFSSSHATLEMIRSGFLRMMVPQKALEHGSWRSRTSRLEAVLVFTRAEVDLCDEMT